MPLSDPRDPIARLLAGTYPDPETGELLRCEARAVAIADTLAGQEVELVEKLGLGDRLALVCDVDTFVALGNRVERALASRFAVQRIQLPRKPHADVATIDRIVAQVEAGTHAIVAVGSGTLNDLAKMVALARDIPQLVFGTAPSMNGYTSVSASITGEDGFKRSVRARTPAGVFLDLGVLAAAPTRMIRAGLGDSICRPTAQADWLLSHLVLDRPYREVPFALLAADEPHLFGEAAALVRGDLAAIRALARTLVLSGFGMTLVGGSFPASQGEHLISHYLEMMRPPEIAEAFHGEQVGGVAALAMARLQDAMLARPELPVFRPTAITRAEVVARFGEAMGDACWRDFANKAIDRARADELTAKLAADVARDAGAPRRHRAAARRARQDPGRSRRADHGGPGSAIRTIPSARRSAHGREIRDRCHTSLDFAADT